MTMLDDPALRLSALFDEILAYANQDADRFFLIPIPGTPNQNGRKAAFYHAGPTITEDSADILHGKQLTLANTAEARKRHRVAAFTEIAWDETLQEATLAGLLRHEIRHAEQFD